MMRAGPSVSMAMHKSPSATPYFQITPALSSSQTAYAGTAAGMASGELQLAQVSGIASAQASPTVNTVPYYSVVVPVYNSTVTLPVLVERLHRLFTTELSVPFEILFVNDGSRSSETRATLRQLELKYPEVKLIELMRNYGQHAATLCGIKYARGEFVITMDDDLQHQPEQLPKLLAMQEHDIVFARFEKREQSLFRQSGSAVKNWLDGVLFNKPNNVDFSSFRVLSRPVANYLGECSLPYPYIPALLMQSSNDAVNVVIEHGRRDDGNSTYTIGRLASFFGTMLFNHSALPLRAISLLGVSISAMSLIFSIILIVKRCVIQAHVIGWTSLIITLLFMGGLLMLSIGVLGEYMVRVIAGIERRPMYVVRKTSGYEES